MSNPHLGRQTPQTQHPPFFPLSLSSYFGAQRHLEWHTPLASCPSSVPLFPALLWPIAEGDRAGKMETLVLSPSCSTRVFPVLV